MKFNARQTLAPLCVVILITATALALHFSSRSGRTQAAARLNEDRCRQNLSEMFRAARRLRRVSGQWPTSLVDIARALDPFDPPLVVCPASNAIEPTKPEQVSEPIYTSYHLEILSSGDARQPLIVENTANHDGMRFVVFTDGSIELQ